MPEFSFRRTEFVWGHDQFGWIGVTPKGEPHDVAGYSEAVLFLTQAEAVNFRANYPEYMADGWELYQITTLVENISSNPAVIAVDKHPENLVRATREYRILTNSSLVDARNAVHAEMARRQRDLPPELCNHQKYVGGPHCAEMACPNYVGKF